jgi:hypothetical protein
MQKCRPRNMSAEMGPWITLQTISIFLSNPMNFGFLYINEIQNDSTRTNAKQGAPGCYGVLPC